jgi:hypothetical protein
MSIETIRARSPVPEVCHVFPAAKKPWWLEEKAEGAIWSTGLLRRKGCRLSLLLADAGGGLMENEL